MGKSIFLSKTFWVNLMALILVVVNYYYPLFNISPEAQAYILVALNWLLRLITGQPIVWTDASKRKSV